MRKKFKYLIGIDEAGRGPLAGPVAVAAVAVIPRTVLDIDRDSKKLSEKKRTDWFRWLQRKQKSRRLKFAVSLVGEKIIDRLGIARAVAIGISRCLRKLNLEPSRVRVLLDGGLTAPDKYCEQKTIIRGDETEPVISLASIAAKVTRDRRMIRLAKKFPDYGFEIHKGYGTKRHCAALRHFGSSPIHRRSFLKNFKKIEPAAKRELGGK